VVPCLLWLGTTVCRAGVAQLAEHNVANVVVVGSNPITRSYVHFRTRVHVPDSDRLRVGWWGASFPTAAAESSCPEDERQLLSFRQGQAATGGFRTYVPR
jgi:hypothetical protein